MLVNDCNILGDPVSIDSIHYIHRPWIILRLVFVPFYEAFLLLILVFQRENLVYSYQPYAVISIFTSTTAKFNLFLSTICRNFYFYLIYNKSNRSFQIKRDTRISLCYGQFDLLSGIF